MRLVNPSGFIILSEDNNSVLLAKREKDNFGYKGKWSIPGGKSNVGETYEEALKREIKEELNCTIRDFKFFISTFFEIEDVRSRAVYFYGHIAGEVNLKKDELSEYKWFSLNSDFTDKLDFAFDHKFVLKEFIKSRKL